MLTILPTCIIVFSLILLLVSGAAYAIASMKDKSLSDAKKTMVLANILLASGFLFQMGLIIHDTLY